MIRPASTSLRVMARSSSLGVGSPEGWLWARISDAAETDYRNSAPGLNFIGRFEDNGAWTWIAGGCGGPCGGVPVPDRRATLSVVRGIAIGADGIVYASNTGTSTVVAIPREGPATIVAGTGQRSFSGDGGPATTAALFAPVAVKLSGDGALPGPELVAGAIADSLDEPEPHLRHPVGADAEMVVAALRVPRTPRPHPPARLIKPFRAESPQIQVLVRVVYRGPHAPRSRRSRTATRSSRRPIRRSRK